MDIINEGIENNFYAFKKDIKNFLLTRKMFADNISITEDGYVTIDFHGGSSSHIRTNNYYNIVYHYLVKNENTKSKQLYNIIKNKKLLNSGISLLKPEPETDSFLQQKPEFTYKFKGNKLNQVIDDFKKYIEILGICELYDGYHLETFMINNLIYDMERIMKPLLKYPIEKNDHNSYDIVLKNPTDNEDYIIFYLKVKLNYTTYYLEGEIDYIYEDNQYKNYFTTLQEFKNIITDGLDFLLHDPTEYI